MHCFETWQLILSHFVCLVWILITLSVGRKVYPLRQFLFPIVFSNHEVKSGGFFAQNSVTSGLILCKFFQFPIVCLVIRAKTLLHWDLRCLVNICSSLCFGSENKIRFISNLFLHCSAETSSREHPQTFNGISIINRHNVQEIIISCKMRWTLKFFPKSILIVVWKCLHETSECVKTDIALQIKKEAGGISRNEFSYLSTNKISDCDRLKSLVIFCVYSLFNLAIYFMKMFLFSSQTWWKFSFCRFSNICCFCDFLPLLKT